MAQQTPGMVITLGGLGLCAPIPLEQIWTMTSQDQQEQGKIELPEIEAVAEGVTT